MQPLRPIPPKFLQLPQENPAFSKEKFAKRPADGNDEEFWEDYDSYMMT